MADDAAPSGSNASGAGSRSGARLIPAAILLALLVAFGVANTDKTHIDLIVTDTDAPLFVVLIVAAVVGALISALLRFRRKHH
ncbi:MAG: LapA family protein [Acidimicrobiia bacterium]|nr:LapA family protein [Acidimicrobiia bacterium]